MDYNTCYGNGDDHSTLDIGWAAILAAGGALVGLLLEGFFNGDLGKEMPAGHDSRVAGTELFCDNGAEFTSGFSQFHELLGYKGMQIPLGFCWGGRDGCCSRGRFDLFLRIFIECVAYIGHMCDSITRNIQIWG